MFPVNSWVRAVHPESKIMQTVIVIGHRKGEYLVTNGLFDWWTYMVRPAHVALQNPPKIRRKT